MTWRSVVLAYRLFMGTHFIHPRSILLE